MNATHLHISAEWERPALTERNGSATLMIRIGAPVASGNGTRPPLDLAFVIDRSGSMGGNPIELARQAVSHAAGLLDGRDRAALVVYDDQVDLLHRLAEMTSYGRNELRRALAHVDSRGGTNLCAGWLTGCRQMTGDEPSSGSDRVRRAILLTDGLANLGETAPYAICGHASELRQRGITTTALGIGHHFDESLLAGMAEAGGGSFTYVESATQLQRTFERELGRLIATTARGINLRLQLPDGLNGELLNPFPAERHGHRFDVAVGDLSSGDEVGLLFEVTGRKLMRDVLLRIEGSLRWTDPVTAQRATLSVPVAPLRVVDQPVYAAMPLSDEVAAQSALVRAAAAQRRAMELDREGRYAESRALHTSAHDLLMSAPLQNEDTHLREEARGYAAFDASVAFSEHARKQAVHNSVNRSRQRPSDQ